MRKKKRIWTALILGMGISITACGNNNQSVEDEVSQILKEQIPEEDKSEVGVLDATDKDSKTDGTASDAKVGPQKKIEYGKNPFLGDASTATSYNIKYTIETDSGVAGVTWGSTDGTKGEYYLVAFDCTREFTKLYTCRKNGSETYDENYTNMDFMYPEMGMFTGSSHIVEIKVDGTSATVYVDSYTISEYTLDHSVSVGQIGTWVMKGDYHETIDDLFVTEGVDGDGDWIYSEDFAGKTSIFSPDLSTRNGKLYAESGYHTVPRTELMR